MARESQSPARISIAIVPAARDEFPNRGVSGRRPNPDSGNFPAAGGTPLEGDFTTLLFLKTLRTGPT
jgi:hypothetical protein